MEVSCKLRQFVKISDDYETVIIPTNTIRSIHFDDDGVATCFSIILEGEEPNILCSYENAHKAKQAFNILCEKLEV